MSQFVYSNRICNSADPTVPIIHLYNATSKPEVPRVVMMEGIIVRKRKYFQTRLE